MQQDVMKDIAARHAARVDAEGRLAKVEYLCAALSVCAREDAAQVVAAWLEENGAGTPAAAAFGDMREDADFWADTATPPELECYVGAGLRQIARTAFAQRARKRLLVMLWETMPEAWRREFVRRVDPEGRFYRPGRAA